MTKATFTVLSDITFTAQQKRAVLSQVKCSTAWKEEEAFFLSK